RTRTDQVPGDLRRDPGPPRSPAVDLLLELSGDSDGVPEDLRRNFDRYLHETYVAEGRGPALCLAVERGGSLFGVIVATHRHSCVTSTRSAARCSRSPGSPWSSPGDGEQAGV